MTLNEICVIANKAFQQVGMEPVPISLNGRLSRSLGRAHIKVNLVTGYCQAIKIDINKDAAERGTDECVKAIVLHEVAHVVVTNRTHIDHGHDWLFKQTCLELGTNNYTPYTKMEYKVEKPVNKANAFKAGGYDIFCPNCNKVIEHFERKCKTVENINRYNCGFCRHNGLQVITK